jgi:hypothetical protein
MGHDGQTIADSAIESPISRRLTVARSWPEFFCEGMRWVFISARVCALGARRYEFVEQAHRQALTHLRHRGVRAAAASHRNPRGGCRADFHPVQVHLDGTVSCRYQGDVDREAGGCTTR